jgi:leucyl/phenylalanyl-tRNA--protein transferase
VSVYLLPKDPLFPPASEAEPDGLIAIGGDFSAQRLMNAYVSGIFPWFEDGKDIYWFSPNPRLVLFPDKLRIPASLARIIRQGKFEVQYDHDFRSVMEQCSKIPRRHEEGTWISDRFIKGYTRLHRMGYAHSAETYCRGVLVGGLYGVSIGRAFFGESMFHLKPDASKVAFVSLVQMLKENGFTLIDCQVETEHLRRFGAELIPRAQYLGLLAECVQGQGPDRAKTKRGNP